MSEKSQTEKLQKVMARAGLGSRREMERWISDGRVRVNGVFASLGDRVAADDQIQVDGDTIGHARVQKSRLILYHKPVGEICTRNDPEGRPTVFERLPRLNEGRWISIGRLDINTTGLLLFTNDGALAHEMMHPSKNLVREYLVRLSHRPSDATIARLKRGIRLNDGLAAFKTIRVMNPHKSGQNPTYSVTLEEGRNRLVRRLWEAEGLMVNRLKRVRFGPYQLPKDLPAGQQIGLSLTSYQASNTRNEPGDDRKGTRKS